MKAILTGIFATTFAVATSAQVQPATTNPDQTMQSQSGNVNSTSRSAMDDFSWDPVYIQHMSDYERGLNSDYGLLMGQMSLTEDQKNQLKKISDNSRIQMMQLYRNIDLTSDQVRLQHMALMAERRNQIGALLTAEQRKQYDTWYMSHPNNIGDMQWRTEWANDNMSLEKMRTQLSLTEDQYAKLQKLDANYTEKRLAIINNNSLTTEQRKEQMMSLQLEKKTTYRALLNADQIAKFKVEKDGGVKIKTKEGGETKKVKTKGKKAPGSGTRTPQL